MTPSKPAPKQKIFDEKKLTNVGISLWRDEVLQAITANSGKLAKSNEYQVHYWAVVIRYEGKDGSILDIAIPTVFFNYEQYVSSAHIDFELDDVDTVSEQIEVLHNIEAKKILDRLAEMDAIIPNMEYKVWYTELNSLHRHPGGRRQGFSGTDLKKDHTHNTGIVFPLIKAENRANFASIVAHEDGRTFLARTEYRLATGDVSTDEGITYQKGRCVSIVHAKPKEPSFAEKLMGFQTEEISYTIHDNGFNPDGDLTFIDHIEKWWSIFDYMANTDFIQAENVHPAKSVKTASKTWNYGYTNQAKPQQHYVTTEQKGNLNIKYPENDLLDFLFDDKEIRFPTKKEIKADYKDDRLLKLYNEMEEHYYGGQHELTEHSVVYADVFELHDCILEELSEAFDELIEEADIIEDDMIVQDDEVVNFMRTDLGKAGMFTARDIESAPPTQIVQWYKEIFGD